MPALMDTACPHVPAYWTQLLHPRDEIQEHKEDKCGVRRPALGPSFVKGEWMSTRRSQVPSRPPKEGPGSCPLWPSWPLSSLTFPQSIHSNPSSVCRAPCLLPSAQRMILLGKHLSLCSVLPFSMHSGPGSHVWPETSFSLDTTPPSSSGMRGKELGQARIPWLAPWGVLLLSREGPCGLHLSSWPYCRGQAAGTRPAGVEAETG